MHSIALTSRTLPQVFRYCALANGTNMHSLLALILTKMPALQAPQEAIDADMNIIIDLNFGIESLSTWIHIYGEDHGSFTHRICSKRYFRVLSCTRIAHLIRFRTDKESLIYCHARHSLPSTALTGPCGRGCSDDGQARPRPSSLPAHCHPLVVLAARHSWMDPGLAHTNGGRTSDHTSQSSSGASSQPENDSHETGIS